MLFDYLQGPSNIHGQKALHDDEKASMYSASSLRSRRGSLKRQRSFLAPVSILLRGTAEAVNNAVSYIRDGLTEEQRAAKAKLEERKQILHSRMLSAETVEEWKVAAKELDILELNEAWKAESQSDDFDAALIETRLKQLEEARINCDITAMLHLVRTSLSRDLGGMGNIRLYKHSHIGTKDLIEQYIDSTLATIKALVKTSVQMLPSGIETKDILEQVVYARQAFGRSALLLSGGATFGMTHIGVLKALFEADLLPRIISGASAGSIVCAVLCTRTDEEIPNIVKEFPHGDLAVFEDEAKEEGLLERLGRFLTQGAWLDIKHLIRVMKTMLGDITFQEAYNRTRRILNICVSSASLYELPRLLNYVTSPNVMIWSAVAASCSVPLLFNHTDLLVKNPITGQYQPWNPTPQRWIDGSVDNDLPMTRLAEMFNVNHFIVSQVNPHVIPFLAKDDAPISRTTQNTSAASNTANDFVCTLTQLAKDETLHRMQMLADLGIFPNLVTKARSVLSQKYSGDITILPEINYRDFPRMLKNPTSDFMVQACLCGEKATWPKLSRIRNHCAVELALDIAVQQLRARVVFSPSQVDLRRMSSINQGQNPVPQRTASGTRRRRVSSSNVLTALARNNLEDEEEDGGLDGLKMTRPPARTVSTHFPTGARRALPPLLEPFNHIPSLSVSSPIAQTAPSSAAMSQPPLTIFTSQPKLPSLHLSDMTSDPDTTGPGEAGFASSDADLDSHTDESSFEPEETPRTFPAGRQSKNLNPGSMQPRSSYFVSQPPSPAGLALNATMPSSAMTAMVGSGPVLTPELTMTRGRGKPGEPSGLEKGHKRHFHSKGSHFKDLSGDLTSEEG